MTDRRPPARPTSVVDSLEKLGRSFSSVAKAIGGDVSDTLPAYRFAVTVSDDEDGLEAADASSRLGGDGAVPLNRVRLEGRRLELRAVHRRGVPPLVERLAGVRWVRLELLSRDGRPRRRRRFTVAVDEEPGPLLELDAELDAPAVDGAIWTSAELVRVEDFDK